MELDQAALLGLCAGAFAIGGYLWRQFSNFRNRKIQFLKLLADNLYFKKLDTNAGVFHRLIDAAEEEECKQVLLAYHFLLAARVPMAGPELDRRVEAWFRDKWNCGLDFDFHDAVKKLLRLGLAEKDDGGFRAVPLDEAQRRLDRLWDDAFDGGPAPAVIATRLSPRRGRVRIAWHRNRSAAMPIRICRDGPNHAATIGGILILILLVAGR